MHIWKTSKLAKYDMILHLLNMTAIGSNDMWNSHTSDMCAAQFYSNTAVIVWHCYDPFSLPQNVNIRLLMKAMRTKPIGKTNETVLSTNVFIYNSII